MQAAQLRARHAAYGPCRPPSASVRPRVLRARAVLAPNPTSSEAPEAWAPLPPVSHKEAIFLQAFGWDSCAKGGWYKKLAAKVPDMAAVPITHAWLPPPSQSVADQGYMPGQLYNLHSKYGSPDELVQLNRQLRAAGIVPVADIVINHRCADEQVDGKWNKYRDDTSHDGRKIDWGKWAITGNDPHFGGSGNPDTGDNYDPAPDLDHLNPELRAALTEWMAWLQSDIGFGAWRFDFVKGYAAKFVTEYVSATVGTEAACVGEYWVDMEWEGSELKANQDAARQRLCNWLDAASRSCGAFDFPTKGILQEALRHSQLWRLRDASGKPPGLIGWWPSRAVTFIANHDTDSTQKHWPFPSQQVGAGYAYILTHPGSPCIFWDHLFEWGAETATTIKSLVALRRRAEIVADSPIAIQCAEDDLYVAEVAGRVTVKLGSRYDMGRHLPKEADGWKTVVWGKDFCVWEKTAPAAAAPAAADASAASAGKA